MQFRFIACVCVLSASALATSAAAQPVTYRVIDLEPSTASQSFSTGINDSGTASGFFVTSGTHEQRAARSTGDAFVVPPGLDLWAAAAAINANGDLAGSLQVSPWPYVVNHAMRYTDAGGVEDLGAGSLENAVAHSINRYGQVAGMMYSIAIAHAFVSGASGLLDLGTLGGSWSTANGINDAGAVVGDIRLADGSSRGFLYTPAGGMQSLPLPIGTASGINGRDQIAGAMRSPNGYSHPYRYTPGANIEDLDPGALRSSSVSAINDHGAVVGWFQSGSPFYHGFVYSDSEGYVDLNDRLAAGSEGWRILRATGINNNGEIVAQANFADTSYEHAVKLVPLDMTPPVVLSASAHPAVLWPPDGRMVLVETPTSATDNLDPAPQCRIIAVDASNDPTFTASDAEIAGDLVVRLRAERSGTLVLGRTYQVTIACSDASGNSARTLVVVSVPHDTSGLP